MRNSHTRPSMIQPASSTSSAGLKSFVYTLGLHSRTEENYRRSTRHGVWAKSTTYYKTLQAFINFCDSDSEHRDFQQTMTLGWPFPRSPPLSVCVTYRFTPTSKEYACTKPIVITQAVVLVKQQSPTSINPIGSCKNHLHDNMPPFTYHTTEWSSHIHNKVSFYFFCRYFLFWRSQHQPCV